MKSKSKSRLSWRHRLGLFGACCACLTPALNGCGPGPGHEDLGSAQQAAVTSFPLKVSADGRYLVDQTGTPFRLQTDAAWVTVAHASDADVTTYLNGIKALGFTSFILMNIVHPGGPGWPNLNEPADFYGNQPFLVGGQLDTPNPAYFARVKSAIDQAQSLGLAVEFFHTYVGGGGGNDGWESVITNSHNTNQVCFNWGVYLAQTFPEPNIIWMHGGDHTLSGTALTRFQNIVAGIQSVSRSRIAGSEWDGPDTIVTDQAGFSYGQNAATSDMQLDSFYGGGPAVNGQSFVTALRAWDNTPTLPAEIQEPAYEDAWYAPAIAARQQVRATYHWAATSGAIAGGTTGAKYRWDWQVAHDPLGTLSTSPVTLDAIKSHAFYQSIPWNSMRPSGTQPGRAGRNLIVSGGGSGNSTITSSITSNGSVLIAYVPPTATTATTFSADLRSMNAYSRGRWWNPTSGAYVDIASGAYTLPNTSASQSFTTPGNNGTGYNDWMLVLDTNGGGGGGTGGTGGTGATGGTGGTGTGTGGRGTGTGGAGTGGTGTGTGGIERNGGATGGTAADGGPAGDATSDAASSGGSNGGCSCEIAGQDASRLPWAGFVALLAFRRRRSASCATHTAERSRI